MSTNKQKDDDVRVECPHCHKSSWRQPCDPCPVCPKIYLAYCATCARWTDHLYNKCMGNEFLHPQEQQS